MKFRIRYHSKAVTAGQSTRFPCRKIRQLVEAIRCSRKTGRSCQSERRQNPPKTRGKLWYISVVAANCLLQFRFQVIFICCVSVATSFGATAEPGRIVIPANSSMKTVSAGLQKLSGRNGVLYIPPDHAEALPLFILLHKAGGSASEWFSGGGSLCATYADKGRFIILAPQSPGPTCGTGPKNWGYDYVAINRVGRSVHPMRDRSQPAGHWWFLRRRVVRAFTWPG